MKVYVKNNYKLVDLKKNTFYESTNFQFRNEKKRRKIVQPNENQAQMIG